VLFFSFLFFCARDSTLAARVRRRSSARVLDADGASTRCDDDLDETKLEPRGHDATRWACEDPTKPPSAIKKPSAVGISANQNAGYAYYAYRDFVTVCSMARRTRTRKRFARSEPVSHYRPTPFKP
jgi:hypothetical protein